MSRDEATLLDMARAAELILAFRQGMDEEAFLHDLKTQSAILHQLLILGKSVKRLSEPFRTAHADIPWRLIAGMRDQLIHGYDAVDLAEVWRVTESDIPQLLSYLGPLLPRQNR